MKKQSQPVSDQDQLPSYTDVESHVFTEINGKIYIGRDEVSEILRNLFRDEAKSIQNTRLWEILNATVTNEAYNLALVQSKDFDHVLSAKMLKHWSFFMMNVLHKLAK